MKRSELELAKKWCTSQKRSHSKRAALDLIKIELANLKSTESSVINRTAICHYKNQRTIAQIKEWLLAKNDCTERRYMLNIIENELTSNHHPLGNYYISRTKVDDIQKIGIVNRIPPSKPLS